MPKITPSFCYTFTIGSTDSHNSLRLLKDKILEAGGKMNSDSDRHFEVEIGSSKLAPALSIVPDTLKIHAEILDSVEALRIKVIRAGERRASIGFVVLASTISVGAYVQNQDIKALLMPIFFYILLWVYSFLPVHPAHKALRKLSRAIEEDP